MSLKDLISAAFNKDASSFETAFSNIMQEKVAAGIQARFSPAVYEEEVDLEEAKKSEKDDEEDEDEMCEDVDQIDEISGAKIGSYIIKARKSGDDLDKKMDKEYDKDDYDTPENKASRKNLSRQINKRRWGQSKAMDKLTGSSFAKVPATEK